MIRSVRKLPWMFRVPLPTFALLCLCAAARVLGQDAAPDGAKQLQEAKDKLKKISGTEYELDGIHINAQTREIRIPAQVNLKKAPVEYMLVHETGKTHESVLSTAVSPTSIQVALLLANYTPASEGILEQVPESERPKSWKITAPARPHGNRVVATVEWKDSGQIKRQPLSQWYQNADTRKPPPDVESWVFNGSYIDERGFLAQHDGSIISTWLDQGAILNSPAKGNWQDELWISLPANIPAEGTPVTLILTPDPADASPQAPQPAAK